jgi:hypothetical protein
MQIPFHSMNSHLSHTTSGFCTGLFPVNISTNVFVKKKFWQPCNFKIFGYSFEKNYVWLS